MSHYFICKLLKKKTQPNWLGLWNTQTASLQWGKPHSNKCPVYDIKPSDGESPVFRNVEYPFIAFAPRSALTWSGST